MINRENFCPHFSDRTFATFEKFMKIRSFLSVFVCFVRFLFCSYSFNLVCFCSSSSSPSSFTLLYVDPYVHDEGRCGPELLQGSVELCTQGNWRWPELLPFYLVDSAVLEDVFSRHQGFITWAESSCPYTKFCV